MITEQQRIERIEQSTTVMKTGPHMSIPVEAVRRAYDHLNECMCFGSSRRIADDLKTFLNEQ